MRGEGPHREGDPRSPERVRPEVGEDVGDAQQGEEEKKGLQGLPARRK